MSGPWARSRRRNTDRRVQMGVHELDGHGAFADCRCAALGRTGTDISGREDPWHARLEQKSAACSLASKDESIFISRDDVAKPLRAGCRTQKQKKKREWNALPALQSDSLEASRFAVQSAISHRSRTRTPYRSSSWIR